MEQHTLVVSVIKFIYSKIQTLKNKKRNFIKNQNKRSDFFAYSGVDNKQTIARVDFPESLEPKENLPILFSGFNDRFNLFEPISNYNINSPKRQKAKDKGDKKYVEKYHSFHSEFIVPFSVKGGDFTYKDQQDFLRLLSGKKRIIYIAGSVGCGKSTFISHLIYFAKQEMNKKNTAIAIISVSAKKLAESDIDDYEQAVYKIIEKSFHSDFRKVAIKNSTDFNQVVNKHFKNHKLTIIIDDLDHIYDQSRSLILRTSENKDSFEQHFKGKKYIHIAVQVFSIIKNLLDDNDNVNFIIGLRNETFAAINTKYARDTGSESLQKLRSPLFIEVKRLPINNILDKRFELGNLNNDDKNDFRSFSKNFSNEFDGLHINGTRHVMAKIRELAKLDTNELFYPDWMLKLYIYLDGLQKYSQQKCGVLNIFLVNIDYRKKIDESNDQWPEFSKEDHYQTFWLKYFICKYFNDTIGDKAVDADIVYDKFNKYERSIFNFSIYSITDTNHGRLISCSFLENEVGNKDYKLEKTDRLSYCFDKNIFFSFAYLSVIVNDVYLEIPKINDTKYKRILEDIFDTKYSYDVMFFSKQNSEWKKWLFEHIKKVLVFVKILENSFLYYEKDRVNKIINLNDLSPDFTKINEDLSKEIIGIAGTIGISKDDINFEIEKTNEINQSLNKPFKKHFKKYSKFVEKKLNSRKHLKRHKTSTKF